MLINNRESFQDSEGGGGGCPFCRLEYVDGDKGGDGGDDDVGGDGGVDHDSNDSDDSDGSEDVLFASWALKSQYLTIPKISVNISIPV